MVDPIRDNSPVAMAALGYGGPEPCELLVRQVWRSRCVYSVIVELLINTYTTVSRHVCVNCRHQGNLTNKTVRHFGGTSVFGERGGVLVYGAGERAFARASCVLSLIRPGAPQSVSQWGKRAVNATTARERTQSSRVSFARPRHARALVCLSVCRSVGASVDDDGRCKTRLKFSLSSTDARVLTDVDNRSWNYRRAAQGAGGKVLHTAVLHTAEWLAW